MTSSRRSPLAGALLVAAAALFVVLGRRSHDANRSPAPTPRLETAAQAASDEEPPVVAPVAPAPREAAPAVSVSATAPAPMNEPALMTLLRSANGNDPALALDLAREGNRRFPESPDAPERTALLIHALADLGRSSEARGEAEHMVNHYPDSHWVRQIERFTGAHRHRNVILDDQGRLRFTDPPPS